MKYSRFHKDRADDIERQRGAWLCRMKTETQLNISAMQYVSAMEAIGVPRSEMDQEILCRYLLCIEKGKTRP